MDSLTIGDIVQNPVQRAMVRWLGFIEEISIIGLQVMDLTLPGYTDGTCPFDNKRYFNCPHGQGYYILENGFIDSYKIIQKNVETSKHNVSDDQVNSAQQPLPTSPVNTPIFSQPISSSSSPFVSPTHNCSDNNPVISSSRGVLSRLAFEREQRKMQISPSLSVNENPPSVQYDPSSSRIYRPENYKSTSNDKTEESEVYEFTACDNENENNISLLTITNNNGELSPDTEISSFGHEYFLNTWTLGRVKSLLENEIPIDNQFCLNVCIDQCSVQNLIDEQINGCLSLIPLTPPHDIRVELIKIFDNVEIIFPSRAIRLYDNDYLLLAILCSNNQCAYVRTETGWGYTDDDSDSGQSIIVDEISQMIDDFSSDIQHHSEQCRHVLKNASFLYYKLVE